jgi:hypothetical protein
MTGGQVSSAPLVSVGIPVFNGEATIRAAIESVLAQTHEDLEVLVYNNGSTDGTEAVVLAIERDDSRVKYRAGNMNLGAHHSFSETFRMSSGLYFMWLAADDRIEDSFVESGVTLLESDPNIGVSAPVVIAHLEGHDGPVYEVRVQGFEPDVPVFTKLVRTIRQLPVTCIYGLFRSEVLRTSESFTSGYMTDVAFMQEVALRTAIVCNPDQYLNYVMPTDWKTSEEEYFQYAGENSTHRPTVPALLLLRERLWRLWGVAPTRRQQIAYSVLVAGAEIWRLGWRALWRLVRKVCSRRRLRALGTAFYWWRLHPGHTAVLDRGVFERRIVLPTLGLK